MTLSKRAFALLALAQSQINAFAEDCNGMDSCANEDTVDEFATLQKHVVSQAGRIEQDSAQAEWRDALEAERAFFDKADASMIEQKKQQWLRWCRTFYTPNNEAPPKKPPFGPNQQRGLYNVKKHVPLPLKTLKEVSSNNGLLDITLVVESAWVAVPGTGTRVLTRVYNGSYPGPTIRVKRGDKLKIKVVNNLGKEESFNSKWQRREGQATVDYPEGIPRDNPRYQDVGQSPGKPLLMKGQTNNFHGPNTTNFHTHGFHVSPHEPQDNVLDVDIFPGKSYQYEYDLSPYHSSGSSWYHPHWHGSATLQVFGGAVGAIIIDDSPGEAPKWVADAQEKTLLIHQTTFSYNGPDFLRFAPEDPQQGCFPFGSRYTLGCALGHRLGLVANLSGDRLHRLEYARGWGYEVNETIPITDFFSVNGQYRPMMTIKTGEWTRLRLIFASGDVSINPIFNGTDQTVVDGCEMWLVAKDNVWLPRVPRRITKGVWMGAGNRAQVMVRCAKAGLLSLTNNITSYGPFAGALVPLQEFIQIKVEGPDANMKAPKEQNMQFPRYLNDLSKLPDAEVYTPKVEPARNVYNKKPVNTRLPMLDGKTIGQEMQYDFPFGKGPGSNPIGVSAYDNQPVRFTIQNMTFTHDHPMATFPVGEVIELMLAGVETHPWHMHTHPVQYVEFPDDPDYKTKWGGYFEIGDWADIVLLGNPTSDVRVSGRRAKVRFQTDCYNGPLVIHCHVLYHEDLGMMTWFNSTGKDHTINPKFSNQGVYKDPPSQCTKNGQMCAPAYCTDYKYGKSGDTGGGKGGGRRRRRRKSEYPWW